MAFVEYHFSVWLILLEGSRKSGLRTYILIGTYMSGLLGFDSTDPTMVLNLIKFCSCQFLIGVIMILRYKYLWVLLAFWIRPGLGSSSGFESDKHVVR
ncbi:hypothetical protein F4776DRAFT_570917 [Hypoxylon sp. NC0597]|nr:hypothetical protein F4776DRAFT_570917 [Hypoxylon sp. NC0597]